MTFKGLKGLRRRRADFEHMTANWKGLRTQLHSADFASKNFLPEQCRGCRGQILQPSILLSLSNNF